MKKGLLFLAVVVTCCSAAAFVPASDHKIGDVLGDIYSTDIITKLDDVPIPSYNLGGRTVIVLEDLEYYGFKVSYDDSRRRLDITTGNKPGSYNTPEVSRGKVGAVSGQYLYTDIKAYVNNVQVESYNIGGRTCACVETLGELTEPINEQKGWSDYNFNYSYDDASRTLSMSAFRFADPELESQMKAISEVNELELYTTGERNAPYYGAKHEPEKGIYAGINADGTQSFKNTFASYSTYFAIDHGYAFMHPNYSAEISDKDSLLLVPLNTSDLLKAFNNDDYFRKVFDIIKKTGKKAVIRYGAEMNCADDIAFSPTLYIKAFRHVADLAHEYDMGVMWAPNDYGASNKPYELYYPGDEYVDWIGISCFLKHDFMGKLGSDDNTLRMFGCGDYAWTSNSLKKITAFMEKNNIKKPLAISEGAVESAVHYADINLNGWSQPRLRAMYWYTAMKFPQVKWVTYFNQNAGGEVMDYKINEEYRGIIEEAIAGAGYTTSLSDTPKVSFTRAESISYKSSMPIYTYAYFPHDPVARVNYKIDGNVAAAAADIPYKADIKLDGISAGPHSLTVEVITAGQTFNYEYMLTKAADGTCTLAQK